MRRNLGLKLIILYDHWFAHRYNCPEMTHTVGRSAVNTAVSLLEATNKWRREAKICYSGILFGENCSQKR